MAKSQVKLLLNLGWQDAQAVGLIGKEEEFIPEDFVDGTVLDVNEKQHEALVSRLKCAEPFDPAKKAARATVTRATEPATKE